ncbi:Putative F-box/FBD/LRR-repeat protein At2g05300 [Linum grandiflorum]
MSSTVRFSKNVSREESNEHWNWLRPLHCVKMTVTEIDSLTKQLTLFVNRGSHEQALALFHHMQASVALDPPVFPLVLKSLFMLFCARELQILSGSSPAMKTMHGNEETDRISELPDEIILCILRCLKSHKEAALTTVLSRRWRTPWRSYPIVEFDYIDTKKIPCRRYGTKRLDLEIFQEFVKAATDRFNQDKLLLMESLKVSISLPRDDKTAYYPFVNQLLELASTRKSEEISVILYLHFLPIIHRFHLPFRLLSNSSMKILRLHGIRFAYSDDLLLPLHSLRYVYLSNVELEDDRVLANLLASSPLLETLILTRIEELSKLQVRNLTNLNRLQVSYCDLLVEIDIVAPRLDSLSIQWVFKISKIEITAPELTVLDFRYTRVDDFSRLISKFKSLKCLFLDEVDNPIKELKLSNPKLEDFTLCVPPRLKEIELDGTSGLAKVWLIYGGLSPGKLKKIDIKNAAVSATYEWKVFFCTAVMDGTWFVGLRIFLTKFVQFQTVNVCCSNNEIIFEDEEVDHAELPRTVKKLEIQLSYLKNERSFLNGLFWICRLKLFIIIPLDRREADRLCEIFFTLTLQKPSTEDGGGGFNEHRNWLQQLKDVKMVKEQEQTCFELIWY